MIYILYNPKSGGTESWEYVKALEVCYPDSLTVDITGLNDIQAFLAGIDREDALILCGGDGTLHRFVNDMGGVVPENDIFYFAIGSGNDFARDLGMEKGATPDYLINKYLKGLPTVEVKGEKRLFLNGVGYGIDGYCCQEGDRLRSAGKKDINYAGIAIKGLLRHYKPTGAKITVDGREYRCEKVWLAPTMYGRYYGGGMLCAPGQDRLAKEKTLSVMVMHDTGKLGTLCIFPSIFKGKHIKYKKHVQILTGKDITVEFDRPTPLQIDGETVLEVTKYRAVVP